MRLLILSPFACLNQTEAVRLVATIIVREERAGGEAARNLDASDVPYVVSGLSTPLTLVYD